MTESEVKQKILEIFQDVRQKKDQPYDTSHFLDFLTNPPNRKNAIRNNFKGARKYGRFIDKIELEFGICLSNTDFNQCYSVDSLAAKVISRMKNTRGNKQILKNRTNSKTNYIFEIVLVLILAIAYSKSGIHWFPVLLTVIFGLIIYWMIDIKIYNRRQLRKLSARILDQQ